MKKKFMCLLAVLALLPGCMEQLDIVNPNDPTPESIKTEQGIIALAQGGLYINGLQASKYGGNYLSVVMRYHELMGDVIGNEIGNFSWNLVGCPERIVLDNGSTLYSTFPGGQSRFLREINVASSPNNPLYFEWAFMYSLNGAMNQVLANVAEVDMLAGKKKTIQVWAWFWKGFAYSRIGSMYHAGIITDEPGTSNANYVGRERILDEAETNFSKAENALLSLTGSVDFQQTLDALIPGICKPGKGSLSSAEEWMRNINTMRARNLLVNHRANEITSAQWEEIRQLASDGLMAGDHTFTLRSDAQGSLPVDDHVAVAALGNAASGGGGNKISERLIQDFKAGDQRLVNNFDLIPTWIGNRAYGISFNTRYMLVDGGKGLPGVVVMAERTPGAVEVYIAGSYEENILMLAEANIYLGRLDEGLALIDELREYQGAGLLPVANTGLSAAEAKEELRRERRVALAFNGFSFYDARRWGILETGRTGCLVVDFDGRVSTDATIEYNFPEYWDVPIAESFFNPPDQGSVPLGNPD